MVTTALVLAGHGSHITPETAGLVWSHVDALRMMGIADEVTAAFWKEQPSFQTVFNTLVAQDITVVPLFTAQGYFTQTVIPAEMKLNSAITHRDDCIIRYARTLNEHPYLGEVVRQRVSDAMQLLNLTPEKTAVAIIGHSTRRNPESRRATEAQAAQIRMLGLAGEVQAVYLDDSPEIAKIYTLTTAPNLIAVPYFLAAGSHTTLDVPNELGVTQLGVPQQVNGRTIYYTQPVGVDETLRTVILELAHEAGTPLREEFSTNVWTGFPSAGRTALIDAVQREGVMQFGELRLSCDEVRLWDDEAPHETIDHPAVLRARIREKPFRSLSTSTDLPRGWHVSITQPEMLHAVVETVYPGAVADWAAYQSGMLKVNPFEQVIQRQTGNYRQLANITNNQRSAVVQGVCAGCVRHPTWHHGESPGNYIPCPEPCNHWLSAALEAAE
ncbi:MAG: hypothetical protein K8L97_15625 [Anaerolineae bacterium]|nr:hypothetical protein [Anaerolineae bacterium]